VLREQLGGEQRLRHARAGHRIDEAGGIAQQHQPGRDTAQRPARERPLAGHSADLIGAAQQLAQLTVLLDACAQPDARIARDRGAFGERGKHDLSVGQRRQVQLVARGEEDLDALGHADAGGQSKVRAQAEPGPAVGWTVEAGAATQDRARSVGGHHQAGAVRLTGSVHTGHAAGVHERRIHAHALAHGDAGRRARRREQHRIEVQSALAEAEPR
jgi:hypothetical protein